MRGLLASLTAGMLLTGCEEDMGQDDWLRIENATGERVYVQERDKPRDDYLIGVAPGESDLAAHDRCDDTELIARSGSASGPVVATRPPDDGRDCTPTWVIEFDD